MKIKRILFIIIVIITAAVYFCFFYKVKYSSEDFGIEVIKSTIDFNNNGIDDYTDILNGAKIEAKNKPRYDGRVWRGGYPPDDVGVCTDVVWRAFKNAGYNLRDMVDKDIRENPELYPNIKNPDPDIDFRRVRNLKIFFNHYGVSLTVNAHEISEWQPGDIVVYKDHIAVISDIRNKHGVPYIIHNWGQANFEEDALTNNEIAGHYRFDTSLIDKDILIKWN